MTVNSEQESDQQTEQRTPPVGDANSKPASGLDLLLTIGITVSLLALSVLIFGSDSSGGANQIALVIGTVLATIVGIKNGHSWKVIEENIVGGISTALPAIMILFSVGSLIGMWMLSGTVPTMIYYGLLLLDPTIFYPASCLLCAITALSIGSSWTVAGTLGIGLIGVAAGMGISIEITAGAIISGAYFGDKMSPLSDTTNLAPAVTGIDIFTHIRYMTWTTAPSFVIALIGFTLIGFYSRGEGDDSGLQATLTALTDNFEINILMLIPVVVVVWMAAKKVPAIAAILSGVLVGLIVALIFQQQAIAGLVSDAEIGEGLATAKAIWTVLFAGYTADTGDANLDSLLSRGGMSSMLTTVWLILTAMCFGAALEKAGILQRLVHSVVGFAKSVGALISTTLATSFGVNVLAADQYIAIVIPGRMYADAYAERGLHQKVLARTLEDGGTITSALVPWNTCGAFMAATLGVPTLAYLPFCFFNLVNPFVAATYGFTGYRIAEADKETGEAAVPATENSVRA